MFLRLNIILPGIRFQDGINLKYFFWSIIGITSTKNIVLLSYLDSIINFKIRSFMNRVKFFSQSKIISMDRFFTSRMMTRIIVLIYQFIQLTKKRYIILSLYKSIFSCILLQNLFFKVLINFAATTNLLSLWVEYIKIYSNHFCTRLFENVLAWSTLYFFGLHLNPFTISIIVLGFLSFNVLNKAYLVKLLPSRSKNSRRHPRMVLFWTRCPGT